MNTITEDFLKSVSTLAKEKTNARDYNAIATELSGKVERLLEWIRSSDVLNDELAKWIYKDIDNPDLYNYFINNVDKDNVKNL